MSIPFTAAPRSLTATAKTAIFFLKVLPMLPSRAVDWIAKPPVVEQVQYPTCHGLADGDLYRPSGGGEHPGIVVCLGVVPFGVDHPQVPRLGEALARSGFAALLYWSPAMRDVRLDPDDVESIALAYQWLIGQPGIDPARSGLLGTCVGGAFVLMAAAHPLIRDHVSFIAAFAPYSSMWTLARDIGSATRTGGAAREPWLVDPLTRKVYVRSLTALLASNEAELLRTAFADSSGAVSLDRHTLSDEGNAIAALLLPQGAEAAKRALHAVPTAMRERLDALSPLSSVQQIRSPVITIGHDRDDAVIPIGESRQLRAALTGRHGVHYTEYAMFQHADPTKRRLKPWRLVWELSKFYRSIYPVFRQAVGP